MSAMATTHQTILELAEDLRVATRTLHLKQLHLKNKLFITSI